MSGAYAFALESFAIGNINWASDDIKLALIDAGSYTVDLTTDQFLDDIPGGAIVATSANLASKTYAGGVLDAADVVIGSVTGHVDAYVIYKDTGVAGSSILICYENCSGGLPFDVTADTVTIIFDSNPERKIMKL